MGTPIRATVQSGVLEGSFDEAAGIRTFKGVPFAAPPVGALRWKAPQPPLSWEGVRPATEFGARPMQPAIYGDMVWRSPKMSEDCLTLNVWAPSGSKGGVHRGLPVLVYFYGGGFVAGAADEPRYDGESLARTGIVTVTVNYRLGIFGFFAHPELTRESPHRASGNYGLLDQSAALGWVRKNIAAFGGDPKKITIGGESAGSFSVSAQMASPLSRGLIRGAIGESGAFFGPTLAAATLSEGEKNGATFGTEIGAPTLADLRALSAERLLEAKKANPFRFRTLVDGYFFPAPATEIYAKGQQAHVPLLAGWNSEESGAGGVLGREPATPEAFASAVRRLYGANADVILKVYPAATDEEAARAARDLASDRFIGYGTWKWTDVHARTSGKPVFRYLYDHPRPGASGAGHANEIEYALGNLGRNSVYAWTDDDRKVSNTMLRAFSRFVKTGDPNGPDTPPWSALDRNGKGSFLRFTVDSHLQAETRNPRYRVLDSLVGVGR